MHSFDFCCDSNSFHLLSLDFICLHLVSCDFTWCSCDFCLFHLIACHLASSLCWLMWFHVCQFWFCWFHFTSLYASWFLVVSLDFIWSHEWHFFSWCHHYGHLGSLDDPQCFTGHCVVVIDVYNGFAWFHLLSHYLLPHLVLCGFTWLQMASLYFIWLHLVDGLIWLHMISCGPMCSHVILIYSSLCCCFNLLHFVSFDFTWYHLLISLCFIVYHHVVSLCSTHFHLVAFYSAWF